MRDEPIVKFRYRGFFLKAPTSFVRATDAGREEVCNGVGAAWMGHKIRRMLDSRVIGYGVSFRPAADVHDWGYEFGNEYDDKVEADKLLLDNCLVIAASGVASRWYGRPVRILRERRALQFYVMVREFGSKAFWAGKDHK